MRDSARRGALRTFAGTALGAGMLGAPAACARPAQGGALDAPEVFVGLARDRAIAVLDPVTDRVAGRISIESLGTRGRPWQLLIGPQGTAAMLPLTTGAGAQIGLIAPGESPGGTGARGATSSGANRRGLVNALTRRCTWMRVGDGRSAVSAFGGAGEVAQGLAADGRGNAYVLVSDQVSGRPAYAAVVDLARGVVARRLPLAGPGEAVLALAAEPEGTRLFAATWRWDPFGGYRGEGRIVALDPTSGAVRAQYWLPDDAVATDLALAPLPAAASATGTGPHAARVLYAVTASPGPSQVEDAWWAGGTRFGLTRLDAVRLDPLDDWELERQPGALAATADGRRAYLLTGPPFGLPWSRQLVSLDLASGAVTGRWPLPEGCFALAASGVGKVYVADTIGDRLWRVDARTDTFLGSIAMPGAPLAVTAHQG
jgi:hypothetical protein